MNTNSKDSHHKPGRQADLAARERRVCSVCAAKFSATRNSEFCPMCMLRQALPDAVESVESPFEDPVTLTERFGHYELVKDEHGNPIELGRGAMGIIYKAFDVDLQYAVTLKVISERYLGDESARLRFLREARAAASVRHPNVASVFHLGRTGQNYFYAMEFVEGETLGSLIKRCGRLEVKLALEIATQIASGLAAVHKRKLVHRDVKPNNIMVSQEEGAAVTAKIIDLGLAKIVTEPGSQIAISIAGVFVGTPEFASPEQFAGVGVDIRSDLYSLGVMLWEMVTGRALFRGSPAEVMYQHLHASLPLKQLEGVPQPIVVLLEMLLEKDPGQRFQNPAELLKAVPAITSAIDARRRITRQSLQNVATPASRAITRKTRVRLGPEKVSVAGLPITGGDVFGREEDIDFLDEAWANQDVNVVTIVAWAGVGKSTLINHWLGQMAPEHYGSAELVFGWSFYRQGTGGGVATSADEFLDAALNWFGDPDPRLGTAWEKGERLAKLVAHRRTLLMLDGLEPLQNPPGPQEGRLRELCLQALLRELAAFNKGLCVITTRLPVADLADRERRSARRLDLEQLSREAGAKLLRALGVTGHEAELRSASDEFAGHCLALTLLGSYLTDAYNGDIRQREEVSARLAHDVRQGAHARKVMESYQTWFGEGPELSVLRLLGLFDRPTDENAIGALLKSPAIPGLTESLTDLRSTEWRTILAKLRRARLLAPEDPRNPGHLDTHPLVREYFGEQLRGQRIDGWKECSKRLYNYYRTLASDLPDTFREMEPLFLAAIYGCNAGLFRETLHEVYIPRIQRGDHSFAANVLGARGALLSVLVHFFESLRWDSPLETGREEQSLTADDHVFILAEAAINLTVTRGMGALEARNCYARVESLCRSVNRPALLYSALIGKWRYCLTNDKLTTAIEAAKQVYSIAHEQNDAALMTGAYNALACTTYHLGDFEKARQYAMRGAQIWRATVVHSQVEEVDAPVVSCLFHKALSEWHLQGTSSCHDAMKEAISLAKELNDMGALANAIFNSGVLAHFERDVSQAERSTSDVIELSTCQNLPFWLTIGSILRGWVRSVSGETVEGISGIERGIEDYRAPGSMLGLPFFLALKSEALFVANRTSEALEAVEEAEAVAERFEVRWWCAELHRLRGVFLAALGAGETQIEAAFYEAIRIAKEQKSISLARRAEATYAEYHLQKASALGGNKVRLPLC
jgi:tRNA A-37 threonylcarbamoyl transferase component Bud32/predicted ATPase